MIYRFDQFDVDDAEFRLTFFSTGESLQLEPKALRVLIYLVQNPNRLVRKQELLDVVWEDSFVSESTLTRSISLLRKLLGDDKYQPRLIETVPTQGYRLKATVALCPSAPSVSNAVQVAALPERENKLNPGLKVATPNFSFRRITLLATGLAVLLLASFLAVVHYRARRPQSPVAMPESFRSIAVLPLIMSAGKDAYLGDALAEEIATGLSQYTNLRVSPLSSTRSLAGSTTSISEIARQLHVDAVLKGSVLHRDNYDEINLRLIDGRTDRQLWAQEYREDKNDLPGFQRTVGRELVRTLRIPLSAKDRVRFDAAQTTSPEAYEDFLQARYLDEKYLIVGSRYSNQKDPFFDAVSLLETATRLDPKFTAAYALLAKVYEWRVLIDVGDVNTYHEKASLLVEQALRLDPESASAHYARGLLSYEVLNGFQFEIAAGEFKKAIALDPTFLDAVGLLGDLYERVGLLDKAEQQTESLRQLDPGSPIINRQFADIYFLQRRFQKAFDIYQDQQYGSAGAVCLFYMGRGQEALNIFNTALKHKTFNHGNSNDVSSYALILAGTGHPDEAAKLLASFVQKLENKRAGYNSLLFYHLGVGYVLIGNKGEAIRLLTYITQNGFPCYPLFASDPALNSLRSEPEFITLLAHLHADWERRSAEL